ncbi:MAG: hypothetical protein D6754_00345 [Alphaproteobacteria bacterium]|nr:MAG: hypothetical protein D6754_00345 [Alphaproteobacteria bacterium]
MRLDLLALLLILALGATWLMRPRRGGGGGGRRPVRGPAGDLRAVARRLGYELEGEGHPADRIRDARIAAVGIMLAIGGLDGRVTRDEAEQMAVEAQLTFQCGPRETADLFAIAYWILRRFDNGDQAIDKLSHVVADLAGEAAAPDLIRMATAAAEFAGPATPQAEAAIERIRQVFNVNV